MEFRETALPGVFEVDTTPHGDERGLFARLYCPDAFAKAGIDFTPTQVNLSTNPIAGTLRGMHFQKPPFAEAKLVRVIQGAAWDVVVDLRPGPTFGKWVAAELRADNLRALYLPEGVAHGFLTLSAETHILYQMGRSYVPGHADGVRWDDQVLGIDWPSAPQVIADKDLEWPNLLERADLG